MKLINSPLRYPGGKSKLLPYIKHIIKINSLNDYIYAEPFSGGAGVALGLLFDEYVQEIILNDLDYHIYAFWYSVLNFNKLFIDRIKSESINVNTWDKMKHIYGHPNDFTLFDVGFSTFYLNRSNRSGILNGGINGGRDQTGKYKINARFNKTELVRRIEKIGLYRDRISIFNLDATQLIQQLESSQKKVFYYFDPPYFNKAKDLYLNHLNLTDHMNLATIINSINSNPVVITYDNVKQIRNLYNHNLYIDDFNLTYNANKYSIGKEIFIYKNVNIPNDEERNKLLGIKVTA